MSAYVNERAEAIRRLLPDDDRRVLDEWVDRRVALARAEAIASHDGPHWLWRLALLVGAGLAVGGLVDGVLHVWTYTPPEAVTTRDAQIGRLYTDLRACEAEASARRETIRNLAAELGRDNQPGDERNEWEP